jgi:hypothetical protein
MPIVTLSVFRRADLPAEAFVSADNEGRQIYKFALQYEMKGKAWAAEIWAYSFDDAEERVAAMRQSLTVCGQLHDEVCCETMPLIKDER